MLSSTLLVGLTAQAGYSGGFLAGMVMAILASLVALNVSRQRVGERAAG